MSSSPSPSESHPRFRPGISFLHRLVTNWLLTDPSYIVSSNAHHPRNYQVQKYSDMRVWYLCGGRLRTIKQAPLNVFVASVILVCGVLYFVYEAAWTWHHMSPAIVIIFAYLWFLTAAFFIKAATIDPGIQPRNLHVPYDLESLNNGYAPLEYFNTISLPYFTDKVNGISVKYCPTCHIWRAPRTSHCAVCNSCVSNHDHHCIFLNNCVGTRNYRCFLWFLLISVILCVYLATFSFLHCFYFKGHEVMNKGVLVDTFKKSITLSPVAFFLALLGCVSGVYPLMLLVFHVFLTANNLTTREYLNYVRPSMDSDEKYVNVFDKHSVWKNLWLTWVATPRGVSYVHPRDLYDEENFSKEGVAMLTSFENN